MTTDARRLPPITLLTIIVEFLVIITFSLSATSQFLGADAGMKLQGHEGEWLTSSATLAADSLQKYGYIPLWQPYLSRGEPLIDNPFSFVLNPISTLPSLLYGSNIGIRYSIVLTAILAGLGGWTLGRMLGFGSLGRVLLGLLLAGKGNMIGMIGNGYFQLGGSQAYIPWVIAGVIGILRLKHQRLSVVLTAIMLTLMFWAGNIYFLLPTLMSVAGLTLTHALHISPGESRLKFSFDRAALSRLALAACLTVGLSAITLIPIFLHQGNIGGHPNEIGEGTYADLPTVISMFFSDSSTPYDLMLVPGGQEFYQSYILPFWFALLAFIGFPILTRLLSRPAKSDAWKVASVGLFMIVFCTWWGVGQNPIVGWLYANVPLIGQWRFVGRMLGIVTFWIAVLAAMQVDALWRALLKAHVRERIAALSGQWLRLAALVIVALVSIFAASQVLAQWKHYAGPTQYAVWPEDTCVTWLRQQNPDKYLSVWTLDYGEITEYITNQVRHAHIAADFYALGDPSTLFHGDLTTLMPEYGIPVSDNDRSYLTQQGYHPLADSPKVDDTNVCAWQNPDVMAYAFSVPLTVLDTYTQTLPADVTTPITRMVRYPDQIGMMVDSSVLLPLVVTVQEVAYPGWTVQVDNQPAKLESVGGLIGVVIPPGGGTHFVYFAYRPPLLYLGGLLTVISALIGIAYLLRLDRLIPRRWIRAVGSFTQRTGKAAVWVLTSPELFEPRHPPPAEIPLLAPPKPPESQANGAPEASPADEVDEAETE